MPVSTDLPGKLDFLWYSRNDHTITLTFPATLAGRTFEVQLEDVEDPITVSVVTTDATFTVPALDATARQTQKQAWSFVETPGDTTLIGGTIKWGLAYDDSGDEDPFTVEVNEAGPVTVSVSGSVALAAETAARMAADLALADQIDLKQDAGTSRTCLGTSSIVAGDIAIDVVTHWGISVGIPYYDDVGPTAGEEALMSFDHSTGELSWLSLSEVH